MFFQNIDLKGVEVEDILQEKKNKQTNKPLGICGCLACLTFEFSYLLKIKYCLFKEQNWDCYTLWFYIAIGIWARSKHIFLHRKCFTDPFDTVVHKPADSCSFDWKCKSYLRIGPKETWAESLDAKLQLTADSDSWVTTHWKSGI